MAVRFPGKNLKNGMEDALLLSVKLSSEERAKFAHFSFAFVRFDCVFSHGAIRIFIFRQLLRESFTPRGNYTELSDSLSQPTACVSLCKSHLIVTPCIRPGKKSLLQ